MLSQWRANPVRFAPGWAIRRVCTGGYGVWLGSDLVRAWSVPLRTRYEITRSGVYFTSTPTRRATYALIRKHKDT